MDSYEEVSFVNMVLFYKDELKEVREGAKASEVLSKKEIKLLKARRIVYLTYNGHGISRIILTRKTEEILKKTEIPLKEEYESPNKLVTEKILV
jgi:hypothetical protein